MVQAQANNAKAQSDLERYKPLVEKDVISKQQFDAAVAAAAAAKAAVQDAHANRAGRRRWRARGARARSPGAGALKYAQTGPQQVAAQNAKAKQAEAQVQQAQAQLDQAELNLSYTKIVAPEAGIITRKSVEINQNVSAGPESSDAGFARRHLGDGELQGDAAAAHEGRPVRGDSRGRYRQDYHGKVTQIGGATGSVLSLFPPENATGNYVKVVQRVPVRIDFTDLNTKIPTRNCVPAYPSNPRYA